METGNVTKKTASLPANVMEQDAGKGLGTLGQEDLALPFLKILGNVHQTRIWILSSKPN